jgi:hypothetical protein
MIDGLANGMRIHSHDLARKSDHGEVAPLAVVKSAANHLDVNIDAGVFLVRNIDEVADTRDRALIAYLDIGEHAISLLLPELNLCHRSTLSKVK